MNVTVWSNGLEVTGERRADGACGNIGCGHRACWMRPMSPSSPRCYAKDQAGTSLKAGPR